MKAAISILDSAGDRILDIIVPAGDVKATVEGWPGGATLQSIPYDPEAAVPKYISWVGRTLSITVNDSPSCPVMRFHNSNLFEILSEVHTLTLVFSVTKPAAPAAPDTKAS